MKIMFNIEDYLEKTTNQMGCYLFKNQDDNVIYVGKAKNIQKRIKQHFQNQNKNFKATLMIKEIVKWETFVTNNEKEAFILEHNLIKKHYPKFNIILTDDQTYPYIFISTQDQHPKYFLVWKKIKTQGIYYGPFPNAYNSREILNLLQTLFPLRHCRKQTLKKPCFYYHLKKCSGACFKTINATYYQKQIKKIKLFFQGKVTQIKKEYQKKIDQVTKKLQFEQAQTWNNLIKKIDQVVEKQNVELNNFPNCDFINFALKNEQIMILIFFYRQGKLQLKKEGLFSLFNNSIEETIENFLQEIYTYHPFPEEIIIPETVNLSNFNQNYQIRIIHPKKGKKKVILDLVKKNAETLHQNNAIHLKQEEKIKILKKLAKILKIKKQIDTIEFLDVSYSNKEFIIAGFSHYLNGFAVLQKNKFYQIKSKIHNEKAYFKDVIIKHYQTNPLPKLLILDGSHLQLQGTKEGLKQLQKNTNLICLVKNSKHQTEYILTTNGIKIKKTGKNQLWLFLSRIQNEGHLYVIKNMHQWRRKQNLKYSNNT